ncbi:MAG: hypothetical protein MI919_24085 [Holophagales bacterium]|nr:hypothetical protein [Holophagales bacterium]
MTMHAKTPFSFPPCRSPRPDQPRYSYRAAGRRSFTRPILLAFAVLVVMAAIVAPAQAARPKVGFLTPINEPDGFDLLVVTREGEELRGHIVRSMSRFESITRFTLKLDDGSKRKLKAGDVERVYMPVNEIWRMVMVSEASTTLEKIWKSDFERIFEVDELIFDAVRHPRSDRMALRQLVNPGFDSRIRVYGLPASKEGIFSSETIAYFGDMPKAFLVIKDGGEPWRVKQREYRRHVFEELYADCPELLERYQGDMRKFKFFAEHVFLYDQLCPGPGSPTYVPSSESSRGGAE